MHDAAADAGRLRWHRQDSAVAAGRDRCASTFPDGAWLVELAPLTDARLVAQAVASVLGVREEAGRPVVEALLKHVAERHRFLSSTIANTCCTPAPSWPRRCCNSVST